MTFFKNKSGATAIEYGLIAALIAVVIITAATNLGTSVATSYKKAASPAVVTTGATPPAKP